MYLIRDIFRYSCKLHSATGLRVLVHLCQWHPEVCRVIVVSSRLVILFRSLHVRVCDRRRRRQTTVVPDRRRLVARRSLEATRQLIKSVDYNIKYYNIRSFFLNIIFTKSSRQCVSFDNKFYEQTRWDGAVCSLRQGRLLYSYTCTMIIIIMIIITKTPKCTYLGQ